MSASSFLFPFWQKCVWRLTASIRAVMLWTTNLSLTDWRNAHKNTEFQYHDASLHGMITKNSRGQVYIPYRGRKIEGNPSIHFQQQSLVCCSLWSTVSVMLWKEVLERAQEPSPLLTVPLDPSHSFCIRIGLRCNGRSCFSLYFGGETRGLVCNWGILTRSLKHGPCSISLQVFEETAKPAGFLKKMDSCGKITS